MSHCKLIDMSRLLLVIQSHGSTTSSEDTYDVSGYLESPNGGDNNLTVALESAWYYGLNVTARPDAEVFPDTASVTTNDNVSAC